MKADNEAPRLQRILDPVHVGLGMRDNTVMPVVVLFELLFRMRNFENCLVYIRTLGMKHVLYWNSEEEQEQKLESLRKIFDLTKGVNHSMDICVELRVSGACVMGREFGLKEFARNLGSQKIRSYHIFGFVPTANVQFSKTNSVRIQSGNFYSSFLCALRAYGIEPTSEFKPIAYLLFLTQKSNRSTSNFVESLMDLGERLANVVETLLIRESNSFPLRLEVTTTFENLDVVVDELNGFIFLENEILDSQKFEVIQMKQMISWIQSCGEFFVEQISRLATNLGSRGFLNSSELVKLALVEEFVLESFFYGRISSKYLQTQLRLSRHSGSFGLMVGKFHEISEANSRSFAQFLPEQSSSIPHYVISIMTSMGEEKDKFDQAKSEFKNLAENLAMLVVVALDAELRRSFLRKKYIRVDRSCPYLSFLLPKSAEKFMVNEISDGGKFSESLRRLFFQVHKTASFRYSDLHAYALSWLVLVRRWTKRDI